MFDVFLIGFVGGLLNTPHCLGMCGGFPMHLAKSSGQRGVAPREILFLAGKTFTYMFLGALAGAIGVVLFRNPSVMPFAPVLRATAGLITIAFGLSMLGIRLPAIRAMQGISETGLVRTMFGGLFTSTSPLAAFTLGLGVGFLPCPLPMGLLAIAALSHNVLQGMVLMGGMGIGTAPGLLAVGLLGVGLDRRFGIVGMRAAGAVLVIIGLFTISRVAGIAPSPNPGCCGMMQ